MPFIYSRVAELDNTAAVGDHQCVALVKFYARAPQTGSWRAGTQVIGGTVIVPGTAIATFAGGRYLSHSHGNHAGFYLRPGPNGFWIVDQWVGKEIVSARYIASLGKDSRGAYVRPSNNADAFSVIEVY